MTVECYKAKFMHCEYTLSKTALSKNKVGTIEIATQVQHNKEGNHIEIYNHQGR